MNNALIFSFIFIVLNSSYFIVSSFGSTDYSVINTYSNLIVLLNETGDNNLSYYFNKTGNNVGGNLTDAKKEIIYSLSPNFPTVNDRITLYNNNTDEKVLDIVVVNAEDITKSAAFLIGVVIVFVGLTIFFLKKFSGYNTVIKKPIINKGLATSENKDFLIAKYEHFSNLFRENENMGEKRVNLFFTLLTSLTGAIGLSTIFEDNFFSSKITLVENEIFLFVIFFISLTLFSFGLVTLRRIIRRNVITDDYKVELDTINMKFGVPVLKDIELREQSKRKSISFGSGGYLETVKLLNSLILGLIFCIIWFYLNKQFNYYTFLPLVIGIFGGWFIQSFYTKMSYHKDEEDKREKLKSNIENEYSLIICFSNPKSIADEISKKTQIRNFKCQFQKELNIIDSYFDIGNLLQKNKVAFRLREENNKKLIALKGPPVNTDNNSIKRYEKELKWDKSSFENIIDDIGNIIKNNMKEKFDNNKPISFLRKIGFEDIQIRKTIRRVIDIIDNKNGKNKIIAELDIDEIHYSLSSLDIIIFNIEIEKKDKESNDEILRIIYNSLREEYENDVLREWKHGKLALGKGIIELKKNGKLIPDENNYLNCIYLNDIEEYIKKGQI